MSGHVGQFGKHVHNKTGSHVYNYTALNSSTSSNTIHSVVVATRHSVVVASKHKIIRRGVRAGQGRSESEVRSGVRQEVFSAAERRDE